MNKNDRNSIIFFVGVIFWICFIYFGIYNPIVKIRDGCWTWEKEEVIKPYSLIDDYNFTCDEIKDYISLELYYNSKGKYFDEIIYTKCKGKTISNKTYSCYRGCAREQYVERCLK